MTISSNIARLLNLSIHIVELSHVFSLQAIKNDCLKDVLVAQFTNLSFNGTPKLHVQRLIIFLS